MKALVSSSRKCLSKKAASLARTRNSALRSTQSSRRRFTTSTTETREADTITDAKGAWWTLQRNEYVDPSVYNTERYKIFAKSWQLVGRADQVSAPGQYVSKVIAGYPIFVIRDREGKLRGFHNVCNHRAHPLVPFDTQGKCDVLRCKYHGWLYDANGNLRKAPQIELSPELKSTMGLKRIQVAEWNNLIFINMDTYADPFETWIGDMPKALGDFDMKSYNYQTTLTFEVNCNWKVYIDNYCEGYHIPTAHPGLEKMIDSKKYAVTPFSRPESRTGKFAIHAAPQRSGSPSGGLWLYAYPNWAFNIYSWGMDVEMILPLGHNKTLLELYYYTHSSQDADAAAKQVKDLIETSKIVVGEDIQLVEAVQRNLDAGIYQRGVLCREKENGVFDFKNEYHLWMGH